MLVRSATAIAARIKPVKESLLASRVESRHTGVQLVVAMDSGQASPTHSDGIRNDGLKGKAQGGLCHFFSRPVPGSPVQVVVVFLLQRAGRRCGAVGSVDEFWEGCGRVVVDPDAIRVGCCASRNDTAGRRLIRRREIVRGRIPRPCIGLTWVCPEEYPPLEVVLVVRIDIRSGERRSVVCDPRAVADARIVVQPVDVR